MQDVPGGGEDGAVGRERKKGPAEGPPLAVRPATVCVSPSGTAGRHPTGADKVPPPPPPAATGAVRGGEGGGRGRRRA